MADSVLSLVPPRRRASSKLLDREQRWQIAVLLDDALRRGNGGTVDSQRCAYATLSSGCLVSVRRLGRRFTTDPRVQDIAQWLRDIPVACIDGERTIFLGIWRHPATADVWCDVNVLIDSRARAIRCGIEESQHSIFDNAAQRPLVLPHARRVAGVLTTYSPNLQTRQTDEPHRPFFCMDARLH